ncbi:MAG TPA: ribonuclease HII [Burkholderiales bacterium]|nr:ribonuclease HII [Burkholderiales bacterium]
MASTQPARRRKRKRHPNLRFEQEAGCVVCGVDEVGCAPLAGPVVAAAVILPEWSLSRRLVRMINDSKIVPPDVREKVAAELPEYCTISFGEASVEEIDTLNIYHARMLAMHRAISGLSVTPELALIDGNAKPKDVTCSVRTIVDGDAKCLSIAAASIVAKVKRDTYMRKLAQEFPGYGWETNVGYGTRDHRQGMAKLGITPHHRRSFAPVRLHLGLPLFPDPSMLPAVEDEISEGQWD